MSCIIKGLFTCAFFSLSCSAYAWWDQGHQLIAEIAQDATDANQSHFLSQQAHDSINAFLQILITIPGSAILSQNTNTMTKSASWADSIKSYQNQGNDYSACHYLDVPIEQLSFQILPEEAYSHVYQFYLQNKKTYNSVSCLKSAIKTLVRPETTEQEKAIALRMITHLVGDISQPFHSAEHGSDNGGNNLILKDQIKVIDTASKQISVLNMHALWDSTLGRFPQYAYNKNDVKNGIFLETDVNSVIQESQKMVAKKELKRLSANSYEYNTVSVLNWVAESYLAAQNVIYYNLPLTGTKTANGASYVSVSTTSDYFQNGQYVIEPLMYMSGVHLAKLLTAIFDPNHAESGYVNLVDEINFDPEVSTFPPK